MHYLQNYVEQVDIQAYNFTAAGRYVTSHTLLLHGNEWHPDTPTYMEIHLENVYTRLLQRMVKKDSLIKSYMII